MPAENWKQIKEMLGEVLEVETSGRLAFLNESGASAEVRAEVASLIGFEEASADLMQLSAVEFSKDFLDEDNLNGREVGAYRIIRELGHGGMGAVYLAERIDGRFTQRVALKLLKREMNTSALRRRFEQEREILSRLEHPNIARLLDAGTTDDKIPFFAMEYVEGRPIDEYCNKQRLELGARLDLFRQICSTVDFAHRSLIVHRDLKPSNILVTDEGVPKLLDFGISKILSGEIENAPMATVTRLGAMTPSYASPEQLRNESVTTATDVYSLGVILYELLSGHRPFESKEYNLSEIYKAVIDTDPPLPSSMAYTLPVLRGDVSDAETELSPGNQAPPNPTGQNHLRHTAPQMMNVKPQYLRGDLDNIVLKALKKEPERRYLSAENFSQDIKRHQDGLPVAARPDTFSYRAEKFVRRNRLSVVAGSLILLAVIGGIVSTLWQARVARAERARAEYRFNDVRTLANSFLFEFSPLIENLPGSTPARKLLVTRALEYLDNLSQESANDPALQRELAKAYQKVGDVQGNPYNPNIGDQKGALASYEKAEAIYAKFLSEDPQNTSAQTDVASISQLIGHIQANGGDYDKAVGLYDRSLALREKVLANNPNDFEARTRLAQIVRLRGLIPFFEGDNKKAIEYFVRARVMYESLRAERPDDEAIYHDYAYIFVAIGEAQAWDAENDAATENLQKGLDMLIPLAARNPDNSSIQKSLNLAYIKRGEHYEELKDLDNSIACFTTAKGISERSFAADPQSYQAKRDLAMANKKLGQTLDVAGKSRESLTTLNVALGLFQELRATDPNNAESLYEIANMRYSIGETHLTLKEYEAALAALLTGKGEMEQSLSINPENKYAVRMLSFTRESIGKSYEGLAAAGSSRENFTLAIENYRAAVEGLLALKASGNLSEYDEEPLAKIEASIERMKAKGSA